MTNFNKYTCPQCRKEQLQPFTPRLIVTVVCNNCGHKQQLCNVLGSK